MEELQRATEPVVTRQKDVVNRPALFPASEAEGNIVSITRRGRHRPKRLGVSFLRCDVTFSTPHHITHEKPKPPAIEEKYPHTFLFVMRNRHPEAQWGSDLNFQHHDP